MAFRSGFLALACLGVVGAVLLALPGPAPVDEAAQEKRVGPAAAAPTVDRQEPGLALADPDGAGAAAAAPEDGDGGPPEAATGFRRYRLDPDRMDVDPEDGLPDPAQPWPSSAGGP